MQTKYSVNEMHHAPLNFGVRLVQDLVYSWIFFIRILEVSVVLLDSESLDELTHHANPNYVSKTKN